MKNIKNKYCPKCLNALEHETDNNLKKEYPYVCTLCNENFYEIEAIEQSEKPNKKNAISTNKNVDISKDIPINIKTNVGWHWLDDNTFVSEFKISDKVKEFLNSSNNSIEIEYQTDTNKFFYSIYEGNWDEGDESVPIGLDMSCLNDKVLNFIKIYATNHNVNDFKFKILSNYELKQMKNEDIELLQQRFRLFNKKNLEEHSKWILIYIDEFSAQNIVGFMELNRYPVIGNATISDKSPLDFDIFNNTEYINYEDESTLEVEKLSKLDTFILINNVEILKEQKFQGLGSSLYRYLEENVLTCEDSLIEITRTIEGRMCNLLNKIEKVPVFTDIVELYEGI